jgi:hypothetical protein
LNEEEEWTWIRWSLAEKFGWTLEYIDNLSLGDIYDYYQLQDGRNKAAKSVNRKG